VDQLDKPLVDLVDRLAMAVLSFQRALLLAGAVLPLAQQGLAQTITNTEGQVIREFDASR